MKEFFAKTKLATKLFVCYTIPLMIIMIIYITISGFNQKNIQEQSLIDHHTSINRDILRFMESEIDALESMFSIVYTDVNSLRAVLNGPSVVGYYEGRASMKALIHNYLNRTPQKENYVLFDLSGNAPLICSYDGAFMKDSTAMDTLWPEEILNSIYSETLISVSNHPELSIDRPCLSLYRTIRDPETREIVAIALIYEEISRIESNILNALLSEGEVVQITDSSGAVVYSNLEKPVQVAKVKQSNKKEITEIDGEQYIQIESISKTMGWTITVFTPYSRWPNPETIFSNSNIGTIVLLLLSSFIVAYFFSLSITKPLSVLAGKMKDFGEGNFSKIRHLDNNDEVGVISRTYNNMVDRIKRLIHDKYELTALKSQAELDALQHQINPHFLFNTLNSIKSICILHDDEVASKMVQTLSDLLRTSINNGSSLISFEQEIRQIERYVFLQKHRFGEKFTVEYDIDPQTLFLQIPGMTLQPLVENVFQHGLSLKTAVCQIIISAQKVEDMFYLRIKNTGIVQEEKLREVNCRLQDVEQQSIEHIGMINVRRRLWLYFGKETGMRMFCENGNTIVELMFPAYTSEQQKDILQKGQNHDDFNR